VQVFPLFAYISQNVRSLAEKLGGWQLTGPNVSLALAGNAK